MFRAVSFLSVFALHGIHALALLRPCARPKRVSKRSFGAEATLKNAFSEILGNISENMQKKLDFFHQMGYNDRDG